MDRKGWETNIPQYDAGTERERDGLPLHLLVMVICLAVIGFGVWAGAKADWLEALR